MHNNFYDITTYFWIFFIFMAIEPMLRKWMLDSARKKAIEKIEKERGSRVILLIHRQETMSFFGFPLMRYIDIHDSEEVLRAIHMTDPDVPIDIVLHTPGGLVLAALQIARAIRHHKGKVTAFVPHYAMSGGTLIALACDRIVMSPHAVLGPVDPQLGQYPAASILKVLEQKNPDKIDDQTLIMADLSKKAINQLYNAVVDLLKDRYPEEQVHKIASTLSRGKWTHDYPITAEDAKELGLPVDVDIPESILGLLSLYPQPVKRSGGVEYLPVYRSRESGNSQHPV